MTPSQRRVLAEPDARDAAAPTLARLEGRGLVEYGPRGFERTPWGDTVLRENDPDTWQAEESA